MGPVTQQESERIARWHERCYRRLGLDEGTVEVLVAWEVDPHVVEYLLVRDGEPTGCTPDQLLRIVMPDVIPVVEPEQFAVKV